VPTYAPSDPNWSVADMAGAVLSIQTVKYRSCSRLPAWSVAE
jgi:hypothetical protein